ncbi:RNA polymerase sigma factor CarQ [Stieleria maiorica]|uniref:RNA polymerase sigma factor CarQ n=1 Tax=Stieleria maiorica TaxID=2795974 RepID=A0A5B9MIR4_9BACT|nr:sigma-70 family RNA polymerase sigma factor [Stieleria maiorica]QEF98917.1 RNA polymerase sigma factor CarQ [Stieleria maiorica]
MADDQSTPLSKDDFALLYLQNQGRVYAYIATLVPNRSDAEDILQRTSLVMWQKWDRFDSRYGFVPWARGIALNEVRNFLRRSERKNVHLSDTVISMLAEQVEEEPDVDRVEALEHCLEVLEDRQRDLLEKCYLESVGARSVAETLGISADAIYMRLHRIRRSLIQCIEGQVSIKPAGSGGTN